ncbi:MAG: DUF3347 domain-containing protein [Deltaproteobacteria bacterium]|nr:DUF3347 domain-containing protein [Deltaproteobacteria bacterium]
MRTPVLAVALIAALSACSDASSQGKGNLPAPATTVVDAPPPPVAGPLGEVLGTYDEMQRRFAKDDNGTGTLAAKLATAAQAAAGAAAGATKQPLTDLAAAATKLAEQVKAAPPPSLEVQRKAFAELSKLVITVLVADPSLQQGRFIFTCPMAPAYQKWVQTHGKLQNPYYGSQMLECGEKTDWSV